MGTQKMASLLVVTLLLAVGACTDAPSDSGPEGGAGTTSTAEVDTEGRKVAQWQFAGEKPGPDAREFDVQVTWITCTGGARAEDPQPVVEYGEDAVTLTVWAIPPEGNAFTCPGNSPVTVTVTLSEPLGDREVVPGLEEPY
jgi:hypothetical protein